MLRTKEKNSFVTLILDADNTDVRKLYSNNITTLFCEKERGIFMSFLSPFLEYDSENYEYILKPAGFAVLIAVFVILVLAIFLIRGNKKQTDVKSKSMNTKQLVFCSIAMALAVVTSFIKIASLPFGGSITLFSMLFITLIGYFYGAKVGITTGVAYGILNLILGPYIYAPLQVLLDYPLAFGALGLSGFFKNKKGGLIIGYIVGVVGRYICHVISGYVFFAEFAPEGMNPFIYTVTYNMTYIVPEMIATIILLAIPAVRKALERVQKQALK